MHSNTPRTDADRLRVDSTATDRTHAESTTRDPSDPPGDQTDPPGDQTDPPGDQTDSPGDRTDSPGDQTDSSGDQTDSPGDQTDSSGDRTDPPTARGEDESVSLRGVFPALTTPFDADGEIDVDALRANARRLETAGVDGVVPVGSTGESATLTHDEHVAVVDVVVDAVEDVPVIAGAGSNNTREALSLARRSVDAGADALLLISPYYNRPEQRGLIEHYETIADAVDVPQIVYNVPSRTGRNLEPGTVVALAAHENIAGYKAASGDLGQITEIIERTRDLEFAVLSGDDALTLPVLSVGGTGTISVVANVEPERTTAMVGAALDGDYATARALHHELGPLDRALCWESNPIPVTEAMAIRGHHGPYLRSPLSRLAPEYRDDLAHILADLERETTVTYSDDGNDERDERLAEVDS